LIRLAILAFAAGCAWLQTRATLPDLAWAGLLPVLAWLAWQVPVVWARRAFVLLLAFCAGLFYAAWRAETRLAEQLPRLWEGQEVRLTGRVSDLPEQGSNGLRFVFDIARVETPGAVIPARVQLGWYVQPDEPPPRLAGGDCVELTARLYRPQGSINPDGFDYEAWLLERGIRATGTLVSPPLAATDCNGTIAAGIDRLRETLRQRLRADLDGTANTGIVTALAVGDQAAISSAQWTLFRQTGVTHLFSVSGLHITLFSAIVFALTRLLWRRVPGLALRLPAVKAGAVLGLIAAAIYTALAGFGVPAQRTLYMLAGTVAAGLIDRQASPSRLLAAGLLPVVLIDPWAALAPGFWLSFGAVAALLYTDAGRLRRPQGWRAWVGAQWAVTLALTPLLLAWFHEVSLVSPLANAFAIPVISVIVVPLVLAAAVLPGLWLALLANQLIGWVLAGLELLARLPQPVFHAAAPDAVALVLALLGAALLLLPRGFPARWLGPLLWLPLFVPRLPAPALGEAWLTVLDVGQGEAVVVRSARHVLLFDAGPRFVTGDDAGARLVAPYLWSRGITQLDGLVLSHADLDHIGGAASLIASHRPAWVLSSVAGHPLEARREAGLEVLRLRPDTLACAAGQTWTWEGVRFTVLHPPMHQYAHPGYSENDRSCVLRIDTAGGSALITGDAERLAEMNLSERAQPLRADVLVAGHHGSNSSSTADFLATVKPAWVLITVGHRNRYGHPHPAAMARFRAIGASTARTDSGGALTVRLTGGGMEPESARSVSRRYWHTPSNRE